MPRAVCEVLVLLTLVTAVAATSQETTGPVLTDFGAVFAVADAVELADPRVGVRAVFDVAQGAKDVAGLNRRIETVARYLNMHVGAGFPRQAVNAVLVLHGTAAKDSLNHRAYRKRFGTENPNLGTGTGVRFTSSSTTYTVGGRERIGERDCVKISWTGKAGTEGG